MQSINEFLEQAIEINKFIDESKANTENLPNVSTLGIGEFEGILWGHTFLYEAKIYYSENSWLSIYPSYCRMEITEEKSWPHPTDHMQRPELMEKFKK